MGGAVALGALIFTTTVGAATAFPTTIEPWHKIGGIAIGMEKQSVIYRYGYGKSTPYNDAEYKIPDGKSIFVTYGTKASGAVGRVIEIGTDSEWFSTKAGVGVGSVIPLTRCQVTNGKCVYHWNGFVLGHDPESGATAWRKYDLYGGRKIMVELYVNAKAVTGITLGMCGPAWFCPANLANGAA